MKYLTTILFILSLYKTQAQTTFTIDNFSKNYYGKVFIADTAEVFSKGWVAIFDQQTNKQLIKVEADELALELHAGKALANIKQLPYGEQSLIMYSDYNFDGIKDLAIEDGQNSCYHGPSFQIYLGTKNGFVYNADFTQLAQEYCGMFSVDEKSKTLSTMTKDGCCWHQFSEYVVENNKPKAIKITEEGQQDFPYSTYSEEVWNGKKMVKTSSKTIDLEQEGIKTLLSFKVKKNGKNIVLFNINDRTLNYALIDSIGHVEFAYPIETVYQNPDFKYDTKENSISFKNKDAVYKITSNKTGVGIEIKVGGKIYNWTGDLSTKKDALKDLLNPKLDNVVIE